MYLGIGSNQGDRRGNIQKALKAIDALPATLVEEVSSLIETKPEGKWKEGERKGMFLNCCCRISTGLTPGRLLEELKGIEKAMGRMVADPASEGKACRRDSARDFADRENNGRDYTDREYSDRPIDIDILLYGRRKIKTDSLRIPHPRMQERDFVMIPLQELLRGRVV